MQPAQIEHGVGLDRLLLALVAHLGERDNRMPGRQRLGDGQERRQPGLVGHEQRPLGVGVVAEVHPHARVADGRARLRPRRPRRRAPEVAVQEEVDVDLGELGPEAAHREVAPVLLAVAMAAGAALLAWLGNRRAPDGAQPAPAAPAT